MAMKIVTYVGLMALLITGCNSPVSDHNPASFLHDGSAVFETDKAFNTYCKMHGRSEAFIAFADSAAILSEITAFYSNKNDKTNNLSWEPECGLRSGNLGYTFGWWKFKAKTAANTDTVYQGNYITVWKQQKDGKWKFVFDGGNNTPTRP
jgi:hypothetical protein